MSTNFKTLISGTTDYKGLYNTFIDECKTYFDTSYGEISNLYLTFNHGVVEEMYKYTKYYGGFVVNNSLDIVGLPNGFLSRYDEYYENLKLEISGGTSDFQTLLPNSASIHDKEYIKKTLLDELEIQWSKTRIESTKTIFTLRQYLVELGRATDRLNLVDNEYDGFMSGRSQGILISLNLTSDTQTNSLTALTADVKSRFSVIENFVNTWEDVVNYDYPNRLISPNQYLFFSNLVYDKKVMTKIDDLTYKNDAKKLILYKSDSLFKKLTRAKTSNEDGISSTIVHDYSRKLLDRVSQYFNYEIKKYKNYFDKSPIQLQLKNIKKFNAAQRKYEVKFNQHDGEIPYVSEFFKDRALGTVYNSYNKKIISNITIT